ncbi:MAG: hypothetical protein QW461_10140 [Candidatus Jordarchaeales archaeon]
MSEAVTQKSIISAWSTLSVIGGIYAIGVGVLVLPIPSAVANSIMSTLLVYMINPELFAPIVAAIPLLDLILKSISAVLGFLPNILGSLGSGVYLYGISLIIIGLLAIIGGLMNMRGMKAGSIVCIVFGLIGFLLLFNVGALLALIGGVITYNITKK